MKLTDKLDILLKERGLNRRQFSEQAGIPYMTVVNFYEKGTDNVKLSNLKKISSFFGVSLDYIADDNIENIKKSPTPAEAEVEEDKIFEDLPEKIEKLLIYFGLIREGEDLTPRQRMALEIVWQIIVANFGQIGKQNDGTIERTDKAG